MMWNLTEQQQYKTRSCPCEYHEGTQGAEVYITQLNLIHSTRLK